MPEGHLLLMVQVSCPYENQGPFNSWYNSHLPNLLRIPGYLWAQRYVSIDDKNRFTALYGVRGEDDLQSLLQFHGPHIHPIARAEYAGWEKLEGISNQVTNIYEQIMGTPLRDPFLCSDRPLSIVTTDVDPAREDEWNRWYTESHVPNLLKVPGYEIAGRFRALDHPALTRFNTGPYYLAMYECTSEDVIPSLRDGPSIGPEAREELEYTKRTWFPHMENLSWGFYKMISKHFKWQEE